MSDALVIALILALLVAVGAVVALARRKPAPPQAVDEDSLRRLLDEAVSRSAAEAKPAAEPDLGRFALLSHEAQAAADAADAVRRTATEAAEELSVRTRRDAEQLRQDAQAEAQRTIAAARAQAAELRDGLENERNRIAGEATAALTQDRKELQEAEQRLRAATETLADEQHALVADRRRIGSEESELAAAKRTLEAKIASARRAGGRPARPIGRAGAA